jgi:hypothetical protein
MICSVRVDMRSSHHRAKRSIKQPRTAPSTTSGCGRTVTSVDVEALRTFVVVAGWTAYAVSGDRARRLITAVRQREVRPAAVGGQFGNGP